MTRSLFAFLGCLWLITPLPAQPVPVKVIATGGLTRGGEPYFIKGAGGQQHLDEAAKRGANSIRIWGERDLPAALDEAGKRGLTVCAGIWLEPECSWFSYHKAEDCGTQAERVRKIVRQFREHPNLLLWGLGNEQEGDGKNQAYWEQLDKLAELVHAEDPNHPTLTSVAGLSEAKAQGLKDHAPHLDLIGINTYGGLYNLRADLTKLNWTRPWLVTEFGAQGFWEIGKTTWSAPLEPMGHEKASAIHHNYERAIQPAGSCAGGYVFLWGQKQEATSTWFSLFTDKGEATPTVDEMEEIWTGHPAANRAPVIDAIIGATAGAIFKPAEGIEATISAHDPDGDALSLRWHLVTEGLKPEELATGTLSPTEMPPANKPVFLLKATAPAKRGEYRLMLFVLDGKGHADTANIPFQVK